MRRKAWLWALTAVLMLAILASACDGKGEPPPSPVPPDIEQAMRAYFGAWEAGDFGDMVAFMAPEKGRGEDFAQDMSFAPVTPKNLEIRGAETLSPNRVRVEYSLDLPELKYVVGGLIVRNPARHDPGCVTLNEQRIRYASYQDFVVLEREGVDAPWKLDDAEGNTLVNAVWMMNTYVLFQLGYRSEYPWAPTPPEVTDPTSPKFDQQAALFSVAIYGAERDVEEAELADVAVPVVIYLLDLIADCR